MHHCLKSVTLVELDGDIALQLHYCRCDRMHSRPKQRRTGRTSVAYC